MYMCVCIDIETRFYHCYNMKKTLNYKILKSFKRKIYKYFTAQLLQNVVEKEIHFMISFKVHKY